MKKVWYHDSPVGKLGIVEEDNKLTHLFFDNENKAGDAVEEKGEIIKETIKQLDEYFEKKRKVFDIPMKFTGTPFQVADWKALSRIKYGETCSYQDIALAINNPKAVRAVGMANHNNPIAIIIPCHRVIGKSGKLVGYGGGLDRKIFLLDLEASNK